MRDPLTGHRVDVVSIRNVERHTMFQEIKTAEQYRTDAQRHHEAKVESWERSDSDGFLSQWAHDQLAATALHNARTIEAGYAALAVIFDLNDKIVATDDDQREGQWGAYYLIADDADAARLGRFITPSRAQSEARRVATDAAKGIRVAWVTTTALTVDRRGVVVADAAAVRAGDYKVSVDA